MSSEMIPDVQFSDNTNQRTPCVLVLDGSTSMAGNSIEQLNQGLKTFESQLKSNPRTALLVLRIGGHEDVELLCDWCDAIDFTAPVIEANGTTPLGAGMQAALEKVEAQKRACDANGISSTRPRIMMISDGEPNDYGWLRSFATVRDRRPTARPVGLRGYRLARCLYFPLGMNSGWLMTERRLWASSTKSTSVIAGSSRRLPGRALEPVVECRTWEGHFHR